MGAETTERFIFLYFCQIFEELACLGVSGLILNGSGLIFVCLDSYFGEMDLYIWYLNLYFVEIDLYLVSELILLGKRDLDPNGTQAQIGPGPKWDPGPDPEPFRGGFLGKNWSREQNRHGHM